MILAKVELFISLRKKKRLILNNKMVFKTKKLLKSCGQQKFFLLLKRLN